MLQGQREAGPANHEVHRRPVMDRGFPMVAGMAGVQMHFLLGGCMTHHRPHPEGQGNNGQCEKRHDEPHSIKLGCPSLFRKASLAAPFAIR